MDWVKSKYWTLKPFDEILPGDELVDCHNFDWRENLGVREPYRLTFVWQADINTSPSLIQFAREHGRMYTNKMLLVISVDHAARKLWCMSSYDASFTYFVQVEVQNVVQTANAPAVEADSDRR